MNNEQQQTGVYDSEDLNKWEMETEPHLDRIYNRLLGNVETKDGVWQRDERLTRMMNELGASEFIQELRSRIPINMMFSDLQDDRIRLICADTGKNFADKIEDFWEVWEIEPSESKFKSICDQLVDALYIFLRIAKDGGMKKHKEKRGMRMYVPPPQPQEGLL